MSNSKISRLSTKSGVVNQKSTLKKDFMISGEFLSRKSDLSWDLNDSFNNKESFSLKELDNKELEFLAELDELDVSIIHNESKVGSIYKNSLLEEEKNQKKLDNILKPKPLILETDQVKHQWWCQNCVTPDGNIKNTCIIA